MGILAGQQIAFTGRLASLTRAEAAEFIRAYGAEFSDTVNRRTAILIVGREGWPLKRNGQPTQKLRRARQLQVRGARLEILTEEAFLESLGLQDLHDRT